jgi:hypothetical protein
MIIDEKQIKLSIKNIEKKENFKDKIRVGILRF